MLVINNIFNKTYLKTLLEKKQDINELNFEQYLPNEKMIEDIKLAISNNKNLTPHIQKSFYNYLKTGFSMYQQGIDVINQYHKTK